LQVAAHVQRQCGLSALQEVLLGLVRPVQDGADFAENDVEFVLPLQGLDFQHLPNVFAEQVATLRNV